MGGGGGRRGRCGAPCSSTANKIDGASPAPLKLPFGGAGGAASSSDAAAAAAAAAPGDHSGALSMAGGGLLPAQALDSFQTPAAKIGRGRPSRGMTRCCSELPPPRERAGAPPDQIDRGHGFVICHGAQASEDPVLSSTTITQCGFCGGVVHGCGSSAPYDTCWDHHWTHKCPGLYHSGSNEGR